jgi:release factor glutamine methyltransferase
MSSIGEILRNATGTLTESGVADPPREASSLLSFALNKGRTFLIAHPEYELNSDEETAFSEYLARRAAREPLQYIRGTQEFYGLEFEVSPAVLIPRPETEHLVETAIPLLRGIPEPVFCDVGTGSGCIPMSILHEVKNASGIALDISPAALAVARRNAEKLGVSERLTFEESDVFSCLTGEKFDLIVSNPPYVPKSEYDQLQAEVHDFEPAGALTDGEDGLSIIRQIVSESPKYLKSGGSLLMEIGFGQAGNVKKTFDRAAWRDVEILPDLQSIPRIVKARIK